jgi:hypothetical protein
VQVFNEVGFCLPYDLFRLKNLVLNRCHILLKILRVDVKTVLREAAAEPAHFLLHDRPLLQSKHKDVLFLVEVITNQSF